MLACEYVLEGKHLIKTPCIAFKLAIMNMFPFVLLSKVGVKGDAKIQPFLPVWEWAVLGKDLLSICCVGGKQQCCCS